MHFLQPSLFWLWAPLAAVPVVLYLLRPRPRTVRTSTLPFFKWLAREHQDSAWMKWLKHLVSLVLSVLVVLAGAAALGRLVVAPKADALATVVVLVDRSASMSARTPQGTTLLDEGLSMARERLAGLPEATGVVVMAYDRRPEVLLSRSLDRRAVQQAIADVAVRPVEGDAQAALELASRLAALDAPAAVWHVSDAPAGAAAGPGVEVEPVRVVLRSPVNAGITALELRRAPLEHARYEAFVQVHCTAPAPVEAELEVKLDGALVRLHKMTLAPGGREKLLVPVEADAGGEGVMTLHVAAPGDAMPLDDAVHVRIPQLRPVRVLWISPSPDPFTELALASLGAGADLEVLQGGPTAWPPKEPADVAVFQGWLPGEWPAGAAVIVIDPPGPLGKGDESNLPPSGPEGASHKLDSSPFPFRTARLNRGLMLDAVRATDDRHPLLYGVATERLELTQTAVVEAAGPLESIWVGPQGPLLLAGETRGQRVVVMPFSPAGSERLPLTASYPMLLANAIYWAGQDRVEAARGGNRRTGELIETESRQITWRVPDGRDTAEETVALPGRSTELDRIGLWETGDGQRGSAALLSVAETLLPSGEEASETTARAGGVMATLLPRGDLVPALIWTVLLILIVESWMYHRCVIY